MTAFFKYLFTILFLCAGFTCTAQKPTHLKSINSRADFDLLKGDPLSKNFNGIECVKIVYTIQSKTIYYLESKKYKWHNRFTFEILGDDDPLEIFNQKNYSNSPERKYILATFNYNTNTGNYFLQFSPSDNISDELINTITTKVAETTFCKTKFKILLNTTILLRRKESIAKKHEIITSDELFLSQVYQPIVTGKTKGMLRVIAADSIKKGVDYSNNILVIKGSSNELPICKAVIVNEFQTPLSHICLLTANRNTPCAAQKTIFDNDSLNAFINKPVELTITNERFYIKAISNYSQAATAIPKKTIPKLDTNQLTISSLDKLNYKNKPAYGSKACNLAELKKLMRHQKSVSTPVQAFAIPFHYYLQHIKQNGTDQLIDELLYTPDLNDSTKSALLKTIRQHITKTPLDTNLLHMVTDLCNTSIPGKKVRFRSSSNAEDEANFNGAGLYTSTSAIKGDTIKTIERAIKKVWASLWNDRAFFERNYFGIDQSKVAMGILVHQAYDDEFVNGVCITKNLYRHYDFGFVINLQAGENEVVSPEKGMVSEQVISYMNSTSELYNNAQAADWISYSSLSPKTSLLSIEELKQLTVSSEKIKRHFYDILKLWNKMEYKDFAMDIEFKFVLENGQRKLIIKQARPFMKAKVVE